MKLRSVLNPLLLAIGGVSASQNSALDLNKDFRANTKAAKGLLASARLLEDRDMDTSFLASYSVKYLGCHHVSQWNGENYSDGDVRILTQRLVRFRMCPKAACNSNKNTGCSSKYGDYVVDINTFVYYFLQAQEEENEILCEAYAETCEEECNGGDAYCEDDCLAKYGAVNCDDEEADDNIDILDYAMCGQYEDFGYNDDGGDGYYIGPYCADQGGGIYLGLFTDYTCSTFSSCGNSCFKSTMGFSLPYSSESIVSTKCMTCSENTLEQMKEAAKNDQKEDAEDDDETREFCDLIYKSSGKCETRMYMDYPNESACTFVEGIKMIREDGVIRTSSVKKSKIASLAIGFTSTIAVLLISYVYYLQTSK